MTESAKSALSLESLKRRFHERFDLRNDQAEVAEIDLTFRAGVEFRGTSLWVLIFAIFIASIGLNVNSTAVVIGAMLISPLMGPIMALGYGAGVNDSALMRSSLFNLGLAAFISLLASTAYFLVTPLSQAHSELLARTTPTIWDVLIALFGGLAGAIGVTRREKSNLIPGVAIATALMPPLCTAGYGVAVGNLQFFLGAIYLFSINCVFIAIATLMMVRLMRLPSVKILEERSLIRRRTLVGLLVLLTLVPSLFLAINLVEKEWFEGNAARFVQEVLRAQPRVLVVSQELDFKNRQIRASTVGERLSAADIQTLQGKMPAFGLSGVDLQVLQSGQQMPDVNTLKKDLLQDLLQTNRAEVQTRESRIMALQDELQELHRSVSRQLPIQQVYRELRAQFPQATQLDVAAGLGAVPDAASEAPEAQLGRPVLLVHLQLPKPLAADELERLRKGLQVRAGLAQAEDVRLTVVATKPVKVARNSRRKP
jgi:uncharacterized hydrophobic protein (TIGR00271 family)